MAFYFHCSLTALLLSLARAASKKLKIEVMTLFAILLLSQVSTPLISWPQTDNPYIQFLVGINFL